MVSDDDTNVLDALPQQQQQQQQQQQSVAEWSSSSWSNAVVVGLMVVCAVNLVFMFVTALHCLRQRRLLQHLASTTFNQLEPTF